jgi:hypothetical protein
VAVDRVDIGQDALPIFVTRDANPAFPEAFVGTGFVVASGVLVTCWHVVRAELAADQYYAASRREGESYSRVLRLTDVTQDRNGRDLATARIDASPMVGLPLAREGAAIGVDVLTFGYPLTRVSRRPDGIRTFTLEPRYLEGYITRAFNFEQPASG